ncbi:hypothetical protein GGI02_001338 [Coemansia sp. RSA 2322]|nr:hypothetical protein GGI02_001338 [Coemansia sp. RSA 2322]
MSSARLPPVATALPWSDPDTLRFDDSFTRELPGDAAQPAESPFASNRDFESDVFDRLFCTPRTVRGALWSWAAPAPNNCDNSRLAGVSAAAARLLGLPRDAFTRENSSSPAVWSGCQRLPGSRPWAHCYGGHQFGVWADQLGDGRAMSLGQVRVNGGCWELQLKGAGPTAYARFADGFAVRRSSLREFLAAEHMAALRVPTSRALALVYTDRAVVRETPEKGAVVTRLAPSWLRFGSFELPAARRDVALLRQLADYLIKHHYPELLLPGSPDDGSSASVYVRLLHAIAQRTADMVAAWQAVGFCHGVMNTDNMSALGLTIDYGPYAFLDAYDPAFVCNHSDPGGRYAFDEQPRVALWNLIRLAGPLAQLAGDGGDPPSSSVVDDVTRTLNAFRTRYSSCYADLMRRKFGLLSQARDDDVEIVIQPFLDLLERGRTDYSFAMRSLCDVPGLLMGMADSDGPAGSNAICCPELDRHIDALAGRSRALLACDKDVASSWRRDLHAYYVNVYRPRLQVEGDHVGAAMRDVNPRFVLRNWVAQDIIERAEHDITCIDQALELLTTYAFADHVPEHLADMAERYAGPVPDWGEGLQCSELCSAATDCAAFQLSSRRRWATPPTTLSNNTKPQSVLGIDDFSDIDDLSAWCAPEYCTLESFCGGAWTLDGAPFDASPPANSANSSAACCAGFTPAASQCSLYAGSVDTCASGYVCTTSSSGNAVSNSSTLLGRCVSQEPHQQVWIGVLLVLMGGATLNVGLNLQKYAFRKRQMKAAAEAAAAAALVKQRQQQQHTNSPSPPGNVFFYSSGALHTPCKSTNIDANVAGSTFSLPQTRNDQSNQNNHDGIYEMSPIPSPSSPLPPALIGASAVPLKTPFSSPIWLVGLLIFILGNVVNFIALQFAPQSLVAPLGAVSLVTNVIIAPLLNDEKISLFDVGGIVLIIAGCVVVVVFSGIVQQDYRLCVLIQLLKAKPTVLYLALIFALILAIYIFLWTIEQGVRHYLMEHHQLGDSDTQTTLADMMVVDSAANNFATSTSGAKRVLQKLLRNPLMAFDRYVRPVSPSSRHVRYGLPLAYASLGSLMATLTTLFAKSLVNLLSVSLFDHDNQFTSFITWGILLVTVFTAASQVYWINQGLQRYDALLQVPVFYVVWTVFDIIGGGVYFNEFKMFTTVKYVLFAVGVGVIFSGVGLLANRLKAK